MKAPSQIAADYIDAYEDFVRSNPRTAIRKVMWLMIHDEQTAEEIRDYLETVKAIPKPEDKKTHESQMRQVHRWRTKAEASTGLPPRGKKGATTEFHRALQEWRRINVRPTKEQLFAGWTPQPLPASYTLDDTTQSPVTREPELVRPAPPKPKNTSIPPEQSNSEEEPTTTAPSRKRTGVPKPPLFTDEDYKPVLPEPTPVIINNKADND